MTAAPTHSDPPAATGSPASRPAGRAPSALPAPPAASTPSAETLERALVDAAAKVPVLFFYVSAVLWLLAATVLGFMASMQLHQPDLSAGCLGYGRVQPAYLNAMAYGWATTAAFGTGIWLLARLCRVAPRWPGWLLAGGVLWNLGIAAGILGILTGAGTGLPWGEMPPAAAILMLAGYGIVGGWALAVVRRRQPGPAFISLWYLAGAFLWFGWSFGASRAMLAVPLAGPLQAIVAAWHGQNLLAMVLPAFAVAGIYYFVPKIADRPVAAYHLAPLAFWLFAAAAGWTGGRTLGGGIAPAWVPAAGGAATILLLIPAAIITLHYASTLHGRFTVVGESATLRFTLFGAVALSAAAVLAVPLAVGPAANLTAFSHARDGATHLTLYAGVSMVLFGAMYYVVPRLTGNRWLSANLLRGHFWGAAYGATLVVVSLLGAGLAQGLAWANPELDPVAAYEQTKPLLIGRSIGWVLLTFCHFTFATHLGLVLVGFGQARAATDPAAAAAAATTTAAPTGAAPGTGGEGRA